MPEQAGKAGSGFTKMLFSPPVIIAGIAIGGLLLLMNSSSASAASASGAGAGPSSAQLDAITTQNTAALNAQVSLAQTSAQSGAATLNANVQEQANILSFLNNLNNTNAQVNNTIITSQAGITNSAIASQTAVALDVNNNQTRLGLGYQQEATAANNAAAQLMGVQAQASAAKSIAITQSVGGVLSSLASGVNRVATASFNPTGIPLGLPSGGSGGFGTGAVPTATGGGDIGSILGI